MASSPPHSGHKPPQLQPHPHPFSFPHPHPMLAAPPPFLMATGLMRPMHHPYGLPGSSPLFMPVACPSAALLPPIPAAYPVAAAPLPPHSAPGAQRHGAVPQPNSSTMTDVVHLHPVPGGCLGPQAAIQQPATSLPLGTSRTVAPLAQPGSAWGHADGFGLVQPSSFSFQSLLHGVAMRSFNPMCESVGVQQHPGTPVPSFSTSDSDILAGSEQSIWEVSMSQDQGQATGQHHGPVQKEASEILGDIVPDFIAEEIQLLDVEQAQNNAVVTSDNADDEGSSDESDDDDPCKTQLGELPDPAFHYEIRTTVLGDCGCVSKTDTYKKRTRRGKGVEPADCRLPRDMGNIEKAMRNSKFRTSEHIFEPVLGMVFDSKAEAYEFYNLYSWEVGFGVRFGSSSGNKRTGYQTMQEIVCEKEGFDKRCTNSSKRDHCKAMIRLHRTEDDGWYVSHIMKEHNHPLSGSCGEKREWNSHAKIEQCTKDMIKYLRENNVSLSRVHCIMGSMYGGMENVPFNTKSLRAVCSQIARDQKDEDWMKTLQIFKKMREEDPGFQFAIDFDELGKVKTLMWASGKSRSDYNFFGDAITFDTTYCTNLYKMPFGMFVGVNNHFQSVLFAGVLMRDERATSFNWVFKEFLTLMGGKAPITILTDQCKAMNRAIKEVMPHSNHLWCRWHVLKDAPQELGVLYNEDSPFRRDFHYVIDEMLTTEEFERGWADLLETYNVKNHPFLEKTYKKRKRWAKPWSKGKFCARMTSTQRSESANSLLKKFVPRNSAMNRFVDQYRKLLFIRTNAEHKAEHKAKQFKDRCKRIEPVERHAFEVYTHKVFIMFREETNKCTDYKVAQGASNSQFVVIHNNAEKRKDWKKVEFNVRVCDDGELYSCECGLFEHFGILCCHAIKVLIHCGVDKIPEAHILKRWTREARDFVYPESGTSATDQLMCNLLYVNALETVRCAGPDNEAHEILLNHLKSARKELDGYYERKRKEQSEPSSGSEVEDECAYGNTYGAAGSSSYLSDADLETMQVPDVVRKIGRPRANRFKPLSEVLRRKKGRKVAAKKDVKKKTKPTATKSRKAKKVKV